MEMHARNLKHNHAGCCTQSVPNHFNSYVRYLTTNLVANLVASKFDTLSRLLELSNLLLLKIFFQHVDPRHDQALLECGGPYLSLRSTSQLVKQKASRHLPSVDGGAPRLL